MPNGDGTGPRWAGRGWQCRKMGNRMRGCFQMKEGSELDSLKAYSESLGREMEAVKGKIAELEK
jgi:hypothetical protein